MDEFEEMIGNGATEAAPEGRGAKFRTPPYIAFKTLLTLLGDFKAHGLPPVIDRSVLTRFAGGLQGQIMLALRSLDLMTDNNRPTPKLASLVANFETANFKADLRKVIEATYPYVLALDLNTATPGMFANSFKDNLDAKEDVLRKCRTFFLHAAREVGIPIGPRIEKAKFPRRAVNGTRKQKPAKADTQVQQDSGENGNSGKQNDQISDRALEYKLIDLMREDGVGEEERAAIWTLVQYLTVKAKKKAAGATPAA